MWVGALVFGSGACALAYQVVWLREFRLVFGAATAANAAVIAVFMGGLGVGGWLPGGRADRQTNPLAWYARLELLIAVGAALSPVTLALVRRLYLATGGSFALGLPLATLLRLAMAAVVLAWPTVLMGGTLSAAARAVVGEAETNRRSAAWLYAINALGAVTGVLLADLVLIEWQGLRTTLAAACVANALIAGMAALRPARRAPSPRMGDRVRLPP